MKLSAVLLAIWALVVSAESALAKPTVAILGLEVLDDGASVDQQSTQLAKDLTEAIRQAPRQGSGPYALASGGNKDFVELKLLFGCAQERKECLSRMGGQVAADYLMYGSIARGGASYVVTVKLFSVQAMAIERVFSGVITPDELAGAPLAAWGLRVYDQLTSTRTSTQTPAPAPAPEPLAVTVPAPKEPPPPAAPAPAQTGASATAQVITEDKPGAAAPVKRRGKVARSMFYVSLAVAVGAAAGATYYGLDVSTHEADLRTAILAYRETPGNATAFPPSQGACDNVPGDASAVSAACSAGDRSAARANIGWTIAGVAAVSAGVFAYVGWRKPKAARREAKPSTTAWSVVPVISETAPGAAFTLSF